MATTTRPLTLAEFHQLLAAHPDRHLELETDGSVSEEEAASVSLGHSFLQPRLAALLDAQQRGFVFTELNVEWGDRPEYRGDIVFYAAARGPELRDPTSHTGWRFHARVPPGSRDRDSLARPVTATAAEQVQLVCPARRTCSLAHRP